MKLIRYLLITSVGILFVTAVIFAASGPTGGPVVGKVVLRLPYRSVSDKPLSKPYSIGMFESEVDFYSAALVGVDKEGDIYIADPLTPESGLLKRFDKQGRFREAWGPIFAQGIAVAKDRYIWTGVGGYVDRYAGLPMVVYQKGKKTPVLDWRNRLPRELEIRIGNVLKEKTLGWRRGWSVAGLEGAMDKIAIRFTGKAVGQEGGIARTLWILMRTNRGQVLEAKVSGKDWYGEETPYLAPDGRFWVIQSDFDAERFTWSKVWIWEKGKERGEPLIDRQSNKEPWTDKFTLGNAGPPAVRVDGIGHVYLLWTREYAEPRMCRFQVEGKTIDEFPLGGERALIVLDRQKRLVSYLPWIPYSVEIQDKWVKPLPDGSGFYRIQFFEKEAQVFFHPLPQ